MISLVRHAGPAVVGAVILSGCGGGDGAGPVRGGSPQAPASTAQSTPPSRPTVDVPEGVRAGYVVYDLERGEIVLRHGARRTFRSASLVKILMTLDYLRGKERVPEKDLRLLRPMLRSSDDDAATVFWNRGGKGAIIERMAPRVGLTGTGPPPAGKPGYWGYSALSALDVARTYRYVLEEAPRAHRDFIMGQLRKATPCGTDGYDQSFGIPRALPRPWAIKQGWSGFGTVPADPCDRSSFRPAAAPGLGIGRPVLHTTGVVGKSRIVVVLTLQPEGSSFKKAARRLTDLTGQVYRAAG